MACKVGHKVMTHGPAPMATGRVPTCGAMKLLGLDQAVQDHVFQKHTPSGGGKN